MSMASSSVTDEVKLTRATEDDKGTTSQHRQSMRRLASGVSIGFLDRILAIRSNSSDSLAFDHKGPLGLNTLHSPSEPLIEYVFVHGLGGGSTKTWCLAEDIRYFWPQQWLPHDASFRNVRIHSFGYKADWAERRESILNIHDFGQSLLESLRNSSHFGNNPIVFIGHSMGGLVIKQAYVLARQDPSCHQLASLVKAIVFLATPHRGSDFAIILNNILRVSATHSKRPYLSSLERSSHLLSMLNDGFRHYVLDLDLYSFYETEETNLGVTSALIVQKDSATLGCPGEHVALLNANHRGVCKFESPSNPNYITLRDVFRTINNSILKRISALNTKRLWNEMEQVGQYLGVFETPDDDLRNFEEARIPGSCEWFTERHAFQAWVDNSATTAPKIYWVSANPATGKSVLSAYVINTLEGLNLDCSYYFFRHGDKVTSSLSRCLRSIVYQSALRNVSIRQRLRRLIERGIHFDKDDPKAIWRKLLAPTVLQDDLRPSQYWVVDALDECSDFSVLFPLIAKIGSNVPVKIFITSRKASAIASHFDDVQKSSGQQAVVCDEISFNDTRDDITLYLLKKIEKLHVGSSDRQTEYLQKILEMSQGCFLWVRLVLDELGMAWTVQHIDRVLEGLPQDMDLLYSRILQSMTSKPAHAKEIAKAILVWTTCATRPLTVPELQVALKLEIGDVVHDMGGAISSLCSQLIHVDSTSRVLVVHLTARTFLLDPHLSSEFAINERLGHLRLAEICLRYLTSGEMSPPRVQRWGKTKTRPSKRSLFASYACLSFAEHMRLTTSNNSCLAPLLDDFLRTNVLSWIEHVAQMGSLYHVSRTAHSLRNYLRRQAQHVAPFAEHAQFAEKWANDLTRIVSKFGNNLLASPCSIYRLIPPLCPHSSAIFSNFGTSSRGIELKGLTNINWDDRITCINTRTMQPVDVACGENIFALGLQPGPIVLYHNSTCQEWKRLHHGEPLKQLKFDSIGMVLASSGRRSVKVWDVESGIPLHHYTTASDILAFDFAENEKDMVAATKANSIYRWSLHNGAKVEECLWADIFGEGQFRRPPLAAAFSPTQSLLAIVYRGRPISLWDLENQSLHGLLGREADLGSLKLGANTSPSSLVFNSQESIPLLAAAYEDGDLCLFAYEDLTLIKLLEADAQIVACSQDGLTLATGNSAGMVQLMEFETLEPLYRVNAVDCGIRSLAFSADNLRFLDVRGMQCNVWEPTALSGVVNKDEEATNTAPADPRVVDISDGSHEVTAIIADAFGDHFFVGKSDGSVSVYDTQNGAPKKLLYHHTRQLPITSITWGLTRNIIASTDAASRLIACTLAQDGLTGWALHECLLDVHLNAAVLQLLLEPGNNLLLVATSVSDIVWQISTGASVSTVSYPFRTSFAWINHPLDTTKRICIGRTGASIWNWETFTVQTPTKELRWDDGAISAKDQRVKNVIQSSDFRTIVVEFSSSHGDNSTTQMVPLDSNNFCLVAKELLPKQEFKFISQRMLHLIGPYTSRLVFLDKDLWVCSVDLSTKDEVNTYIRHFFAPSDWLSQQRDLKICVTSKGDILFVKQTEIAVIRNGLQLEELITASLA